MIQPIGSVEALPTSLVHAALPPGAYTLWVVPWNAVNEDYRLEAVFS